MASEFGPLFAREDESPQPEPSEHTYGVLELNEAIASALERAFPTEIWLRGEIQGLSRNRGRRHLYFELVEKEEHGDQPKSRVSIALLSWNRTGVERDLRSAPGFELDDDLEVRIRCRVGYYAPWGKLQLTMMGVDPAYTLGKLAQNRERILKQLAAEGLLERNAQLPMPLLPLRVGLVTSVGSAAYNDFVQELGRHGYAFRLHAIDVRVQGSQTEPQVVAALRSLARRELDLIALIRGGGSRSDLAAFDSEAIARTIAAMPVPVWTGIGHEIDQSVADFVGHRSFKTPTACAVAIYELAAAFEQRIEEQWEGIHEGAMSRLAAQAELLAVMAQRASRASRSRLRLAHEKLAGARSRLFRESRRTLPRRRETLRRSARRLRELSFDRLLRQFSLLENGARRLPALARRPLRQEEQQLARIEGQIRALDPRRVLRRGYSLTRGPDGRLLRSLESIEPGELLETELADGRVASRVESTFPLEDHEREEGR